MFQEYKDLSFLKIVRVSMLINSPIYSDLNFFIIYSLILIIPSTPLPIDSFHNATNSFKEAKLISFQLRHCGSVYEEESLTSFAFMSLYALEGNSEHLSMLPI